MKFNVNTGVFEADIFEEGASKLGLNPSLGTVYSTAYFEEINAGVPLLGAQGTGVIYASYEFDGIMKIASNSTIGANNSANGYGITNSNIYA